MIEFKKTDYTNIADLMSVRLEMLRIVNDLSADYEFDESFINSSREYFLNGNQTSVIAKDEENVIGCASISYINIMPTFSHPTGKRAHLMNVYVNKSYRRQGIARKMILMLVEEARAKGCTEISLDATTDGYPLYKAIGFKENKEGMVLPL